MKKEMIMVVITNKNSNVISNNSNDQNKIKVFYMIILMRVDYCVNHVDNDDDIIIIIRMMV